MDTHVPREVLSSSRPCAKSSGKSALYILSNGSRIEVIESWIGGFSTPVSGPQLTHGIIDLFDGRMHVTHGLAYLASVETDARVYAFETVQRRSDAPAVDHVRLTPAPSGLLPKKLKT